MNKQLRLANVSVELDVQHKALGRPGSDQLEVFRLARRLALDVITRGADRIDRDRWVGNVMGRWAAVVRLLAMLNVVEAAIAKCN